MSSEQVKVQCNILQSNNHGMKNNLKSAMHTCVKELAENISQFKDEIGIEVAREMLEGCEKNLILLRKAEQQIDATDNTLRVLPGNLGENPSPDDVHRTFGELHEQAIRQQGQTSEARSASDELRKLKEKLVSSASSNPEQQDEDEDVVMTQQTITNFKCPLLQMDMQLEGELRPVISNSCPGNNCIFSHKGIHDFFKQNKKPPVACPKQGCSNKAMKLQDLVPAKEMIRAIKRAQNDLMVD